MHDCANLVFRKQIPHSVGIAAVSLDKLEIPWHRTGNAGCQIVNDDDRPAGIAQREQNVATDVPCATRHGDCGLHCHVFVIRGTCKIPRSREFFRCGRRISWQSGPLRDSVGFPRPSTEGAAPWRQCGHCTSPGITLKPTCSRGSRKRSGRLARDTGASWRFPGSRASRAFCPVSTACPAGRPAEDRAALARAFTAKAVLNLPTTRAPSGRFQVDRTLRRLCGWSGPGEIPSEATFSRSFAGFSECALPARLHEAAVRRTLGDRVIGHVSRDRRRSRRARGRSPRLRSPRSRSAGAAARARARNGPGSGGVWNSSSG